MKITKQQWDKIGPLLSTALELNAITREKWLADIAQTDAEIAPLLKQMLATHDQAERASELETVPKLASPPPLSSLFHPRDMIGAYRLVLLLGRGGMGEVWLADQADGRIIRQVALKLPTQVQHLEVWRRRFQRERDILAKLTHPNIARLFDAGVDDKLSRIGIGQPYLALEYIEGKSLNEYVDTKSLPIAARLKLFRQVLAATTHAHQHLVVHRDLKPGNILVTASGEVKLLDFGIAKLIDDAAMQTTDDSNAAQHQSATELTRIGGRVMTLRYAAPEQVTGDAITTATDVYALGVILHELITGLSPYRATREAKRLTEAALTDEPTSVPSALSFATDDVHKRGLRTARQLTKQVAGDLDAIVLKAMRKQPDERYLSVAALDDDVRRHLEGNPVHARKGTWRYLTGRFVMRHKIPMAAAALVLITIMGGLIAIDQQRRVAVAERERAERHFRSVRTLANSLMFDVHDQIDHLPGATKAKQVLIENASKYLAQLSNESKLDPQSKLDTPLSIELAKAYARLADIQGQNDFSNIGKPDAALANYQRVVELLTPIAQPAIKPTSTSDLEFAHIADYELSRAYRKVGGIQRAMGKLEAAYTSNKTGAEFALHASQSANATPEDKTLHIVMDYERERSLAGLRKDRVIRLKGATDAVAAMETLRIVYPNNDELMDRLAWCYSENGHALRDDKDPEVKHQAIKQYEMALAIREAALLRAPNDVTLQRAILSHHNALGHTYTQLREFDNAIKQLRAADDNMVRISLQDVGNVQFNSDAVQTIASLADAQQAAGDNKAAHASADEGLKRLAAMPDEARTLRRTVAAEASLQKIIGEVLLYEAKIMQAASAQSSDKVIQKLITAREAFVAGLKAISQGAPTTGYEKKRADVIADMQKQIDEIDRRLMRLKTKR